MEFTLILGQHTSIVTSSNMNSLILMSAMWDYQKMAPTRLTDSVLESMLWNKAPVCLQQEVKEITVGSVQALLGKLLCAKSVVQERKQ